MAHGKNLVIVESPTKAKTIGRFLGRDYALKASLGHIRDLPAGRQLGVRLDGSFAPHYVVPPDKRAVVKEINEAVHHASIVYLATDPDREGEAIAWHLTQVAKLDGKPVQRVVFHEITAAAIQEAFEHPRQIDERLVNAQQARRVLDRLVGYKLSPLLWQRIRGGLSAGRVQSAALRMVADREREIGAFVPKEYWRIFATLAKRPGAGQAQGAAFTARLAGEQGVRGQVEIGHADAAHAITEDLAPAVYTVAAVRKREGQRRPTAPFTTSTLQQEAWRKLRFPVRKTMAVAQQLYEGLAVGPEGAVGLITYMRTDSVIVSRGAIQEAREFIGQRFGAGFVPPSPRLYTAKAKGAQEAHEAIRPTAIARDPEAIKQRLSPDQYRLYSLIWKRMVASQMANALFETTTAEIEAGGAASGTVYLFQADGVVQKFAGFLALYTEGTDTEDEDEAGALPPLDASEGLDLAKPLEAQQKFTQPPPRYTEASLVKAMEENGIGRPSTYAPTLSTIQERGYVTKDAGALKPEPLGLTVDDLLKASFPDVVNLQFTARMEEGLDEIAEGKKEWVAFLSDFYGPFQSAVEKATAEACDKCGKPMAIKDGRFGPFLACTGYPDCRNAKPIRKKASEPSGELCDKCGKPMLIREGRYGSFLGCSGYPECRNLKAILVKVGVPCPSPDCGGELVEKTYKKARAIKRFYGCSNYPKCDFATSLKPISEPCPKCSGLLTAFPRGGVKCTRCDYKGRPPRKRPGDQAEAEAEPEAVAAGG